jgi:hypothetical protein
MRNVIRAIICIAWLLSTVVMSRAQGWRGIVPLHSTRAEVEALIGPPMQPNGRTYDLKDERVNVVYSEGACDNNKVEWNVPPDTVIGITIYPQKKLLISDLRTDLNKFEKLINPHNPDSVSYNNKKEGIALGTKSNGEVVVIEYFSAARDSHLRCPQFVPNQLSNDEMAYFKFDEYSTLPFSDEKARLDNFAVRLLREPGMKGYIIVFPGQGMPSGAAQARAKRAKDYLVKARGVDAVRIVTIKGARREKFEVELYALPGSISFPTLNLSHNE